MHVTQILYSDIYLVLCADSLLFYLFSIFKVPLFQLPDVTLMVSVFNKQNMKRVRKEMIGWFSLGMNSSGEEELTHWNDMKDNHGEQVHNTHLFFRCMTYFISP